MHNRFFFHAPRYLALLLVSAITATLASFDLNLSTPKLDGILLGVAACIAETGATSKKEMGAVMKLASERAAGRVDGRVLSAAVNAQLQ